jgi:sortase A
MTDKKVWPWFIVVILAVFLTAWLAWVSPFGDFPSFDNSGLDSSNFLLNEPFANPFEQSSSEKPGLPELPQMANGDNIGTIIIDNISLEDDIYLGKSKEDAEEILTRNVCMLNYVSMDVPGIGGMSVMAGHNFKKFNKLRNLEVGDRVILDLCYGSYEYEVTEMYISEDIRAGKADELVLYTRYPFEQIDGTEMAFFVCELVDGPRFAK